MNLSDTRLAVSVGLCTGYTATLVAVLSMVLVFVTGPAAAADPFITAYSNRHHARDEALFNHFSRTTGIAVHRIEGWADEMIDAIKTGAPGPRPDVFISVEAAPLDRAEQLGLFEPITSKVVEAAVPSRLRTGHWNAFSSRATVIIYNKDLVSPDEVRNYADLASPKLAGKLCTAEQRQPFSRSLLASIIVNEGAERAEQWARGVVANRAHIPKGGDIDQIMAVADGEPCEVALSNAYHLSALLRSTVPDDRKAMSEIGIVWPNQAGTGTHMRLSGVGLLKGARNRESAIQFIEFLVSDYAQRYLAENDEWPVVEAVPARNPVLDAIGPFKADPISVQQLVGTEVPARKILDRVGYR